MKSLDEFRTYYNSMYYRLVALDSQRENVKRRLDLMYGLVVVIGVCLFLIFYRYKLIPTLLITVVVISIQILTGYILQYFIKRNYLIEFKEIFIKEAIVFFSESLEYKPDAFIPIEEFNLSRLYIGSPDQYTGEDLVSGTLYSSQEKENLGKGINIKMSELEVKERRRGHKGQSHYATYFKGVFMIIDFNKNFKGETFILEDAGVFNYLGGRNGTERVKLEDIDFEKKFAVYGTDEIETRELLTPSFIDDIYEMSCRIGKPKMALINNKMYIGIPTKGNILEPMYKDSLLEFDNVKKYYDQLAKYFKVIEELNLDE
ncbi:uncharacterized protein DUF3137 [Natranaerovirga pectinivora]|uniref:Uncharacterized protein DUF3137 n=1 Tax=Natranaerovirga pectinivora TaxID=682400 RepID=A0A4R3MS80_9FIRM|nr:DUF3137 domain-containing protein [Natranaerovirga pectinivora]TCT17078.1 uncharacterized protein DUF3137 [Natranaerovirga pectinivora]